MSAHLSASSISDISQILHYLGAYRQLVSTMREQAEALGVLMSRDPRLIGLEDKFFNEITEALTHLKNGQRVNPTCQHLDETLEKLTIHLKGIIGQAMITSLASKIAKLEQRLVGMARHSRASKDARRQLEVIKALFQSWYLVWDTPKGISTWADFETQCNELGTALRPSLFPWVQLGVIFAGIGALATIAALLYAWNT